MDAKAQIKKRILALIEKSEDEHLLEMVYQILYQSNDQIHLTAAQEKELSAAYLECFDDKHLIDHETVKEKNAKCLEK